MNTRSFDETGFASNLDKSGGGFCNCPIGSSGSDIIFAQLQIYALNQELLKCSGQNCTQRSVQTVATAPW